jgi:hypothetical protein
VLRVTDVVFESDSFMDLESNGYDVICFFLFLNYNHFWHEIKLLLCKTDEDVGFEGEAVRQVRQHHNPYSTTLKPLLCDIRNTESVTLDEDVGPEGEAVRQVRQHHQSRDGDRRRRRCRIDLHSQT